MIDSRDVIQRIRELEEQREEEGEDFAEEDAAELSDLLALQEEAEGYAPDWQHGATLIADSYFRDYAEQLADDIGAIDRNASWPTCHIDWDAAADSLRQDYTSVTFAGKEYWVR